MYPVFHPGIGEPNTGKPSLLPRIAVKQPMSFPYPPAAPPASGPRRSPSANSARSGAGLGFVRHSGLARPNLRRSVLRDDIASSLLLRKLCLCAFVRLDVVLCFRLF